MYSVYGDDQLTLLFLLTVVVL